MAPALTETNQEDNFKLPHSPNTTTIINQGITQSNGDRYTCNIPFEILPTKCNIFIGNLSKSNVDLNCYNSDRLASNNSHINGNSLLDKGTINSDSIHSLSTVFDNGNTDSLTNGVVGKNSQEKSMKSISNDMCELSKLVAQKLVHSDVNMHCIDHVYLNDKNNLRNEGTNNLPIKINGELIMDSSNASKCDEYIPDSSPNILNEEKLWAEATRRVEKLQQNSVRLMKRIRYLQMRKATTHVKSEIGAFVSYGQSRLDAHQDSHKRLKLSQKPILTNRVANTTPSVTLTNLEKKKFHYLRERQVSTTVPTNIETKANNKNDYASVRIDPKDCAEIKRTVGTLRFNLSHLGLSVDSDVTDSSSGGESCEETEEINDKKRNTQVPIHRRAVWKWSVNRAEIANRWIWLQAQILDLEQRIRRLNSLCQKFRSVKKTPFQPVRTDGNAKCECQKEVAVCSADEDNGASVKLMNGYTVERTDDINCKYNHSESCLFGTSRTRPFESFRKRKLFKLKDICVTGTKASRLSAVKCSCKSQESMVSCILCTGQYNKTFALDPEMMALSEKTALLEPSYHSVLSLHQDIPLSFHFEMLLKRCRISRQSTKADGLPNKKPHLVSHITSQQHRRRYKQAKKVAEILLPSAASLKRQKDQSLPSSPNNSRPSSPSSYAFFNPDGTSSVTGRRRRESAYDINNIVIPCCIVPAIRIEKLQYKEILTPKWRIACEEKMTANNDETKMEIVEDLSDEAFLTRHQKCELKEKKWFMSYIRVRTYGRGRSRSLRFDVVPNSPHSFSNTEDFFSGCDDILSNPHSPGVFSTVSSSDMSLEEETKDSIPDEESNDTFEYSTDEPVEIVEKKPYDRRTFPLTDEQFEEMLMEVSMPEQINNVFLTTNSPPTVSAILSEET